MRLAPDIVKAYQLGKEMRYDEAYQIYKNNVLDLQNEYVKKLVKVNNN